MGGLNRIRKCQLLSANQCAEIVLNDLLLTNSFKQLFFPEQCFRTFVWAEFKHSQMKASAVELDCIAFSRQNP